eukprot:scaffold46351_cov270-Skeletonema_marinoi.AAC.2
MSLVGISPCANKIPTGATTNDPYLAPRKDLGTSDSTGAHLLLLTFHFGDYNAAFKGEQARPPE